MEKMLLLSQKLSASTYSAWVAGTIYAVGDKCTYLGRSYICTSAHTASASFPYTTTYTTSAIMVAGETVTINGITYTAVAAGTAANSREFSIGISEAACLANLALAIASATA